MQFPVRTGQWAALTEDVEGGGEMAAATAWTEREFSELFLQTLGTISLLLQADTIGGNFSEIINCLAGSLEPPTSVPQAESLVLASLAIPVGKSFTPMLNSFHLECIECFLFC